MIRVTLAGLVAAAVGSTASAAAPEPDYGRYKALVIGINAYADLPALKTAVNDAGAMHDLLRTRYGFDSILLLNPTRYDMVRALDRLRAELTQDDNLVIFYAGHGVLDAATGQGFWLPVDAEPNSQANWISVATVTRTLRASTAKHALVIADSYYSGTLTREAPVALETGADRAGELQRLANKRARKVLSSGGLEPASDALGDGHSVFTRAVLNTLRENSQVLEGYQLFAAVRRQVVVSTEQTPEYADIRKAGDEGGEFLFVPTRAASRQPVPPAPTEPPVQPRVQPRAQPFVTQPTAQEVELAFWRSMQDSTNPADYEAYSTRYPSGVFIAIARARLARLKPPAGSAPAPPAAPPDAVEQAFWDLVKRSDSALEIGAYLDTYPAGPHAAQAAARLAELEAGSRTRMAPEPEPVVISRAPSAPISAPDRSDALDGVWVGEACDREFRIEISAGKVFGKIWRLIGNVMVGRVRSGALPVIGEISAAAEFQQVTVGSSGAGATLAGTPTAGELRQGGSRCRFQLALVGD